MKKCNHKIVRPGLLLLGLGLSLSLGLSGCAGSSGSAGASAAQRLPETYALPEAERPRAEPREGTIFNGGQGLDLYRDNRAREVGDIVLVRVVETSSGRNNAKTTAERESSIAAGLDNFFGLGEVFRERSAVRGRITNDFEGGGGTTRNSDVTATISARIIDKTMEGNLVIRGYQEVRVNNETQFIILSGLVRPDDITADNAVLSNRIADARIEYSGKGVVADKQRPGWLSRTVDAIWPF